MFESLNTTGTLKIDGEGKLLELAPWSDQDAGAGARDEGIELTPKHLTLFKTLRAFYLRNGPLTAREILQHMESLVAELGGRRYLYQLFPQRSGAPSLAYYRPTDPQRQQRPIVRQCDVKPTAAPVGTTLRQLLQLGAAGLFKPRSTPTHYHPDRGRTGRGAPSGCA